MMNPGRLEMEITKRREKRRDRWEDSTKNRLLNDGAGRVRQSLIDAPALATGGAFSGVEGLQLLKIFNRTIQKLRNDKVLVRR
jgi:hypothetical protein